MVTWGKANERKVGIYMNYLVTGADGFIGANYINYLIENDFVGGPDEIFVLQRKLKPDILSPLSLSGHRESTIPVFADLRDFSAIKDIIMKNEINFILHFAAQAIVKFAQRDPLTTFHVNMVGTLNLMEASRIAGVNRIFIMSTDKVYGDEPAPYIEDTNIGTDMGIYDASKSCAEIIARSYKATYGINVSVGRSCNVYGPLDLNFSRVIPGVIKEILLTGKYKVYMPSNKIQTREFIYTKDLCRAINLISVAGENDIYNIGSDELHDIYNVKETIAKVLGFGEKVEIEDNRGFKEIEFQSVDDSKLRSSLRFDNRYDLNTGLLETVAWYVEYIKC